MSSSMGAPRPLLLPLALAALLPLASAQDIPNTIAGHVLPSWVAPALAGVFVLVGLLQVTAGYKLFRVTLFLLGFLAAFLGISLSIIEYVPLDSAPWIGLGLGGAVGLAVGVTAAMFPRAGVFLISATAGVCVGLLINTAFGFKIPLDPKITMGCLAAACGVAFGVFSTLFMRITVILATSVIGAFLVIYGIGRLIPAPHNFPDVLDLANELINNTMPGYVYGYLAGWAVLAVFGVALQLCVTGRKPAGKENEKDEWERIVEDGQVTSPGKGGKRSKRDKRSRKDGGGSGRRGGSSSARKVRASERLKAGGGGGGGGGGGDAALLDDYDEAYGDEEDGGGEYELGNGSAYGEDPSPHGNGGGWGRGAPDEYGGAQEDAYYEEQQQQQAPPQRGGRGGGGGGNGGSGKWGPPPQEGRSWPPQQSQQGGGAARQQSRNIAW